MFIHEFISFTFNHIIWFCIAYIFNSFQVSFIFTFLYKSVLLLNEDNEVDMTPVLKDTLESDINIVAQITDLLVYAS